MTGFISKRFNAPRMMPRSIRAMRAISIVGIAVAVASLVIAVSIGRGFEKAYKRALLDFNSHVIIMGGNEDTRISEVDAAIKDVRFLSSTPFIYREGLALANGKIRGIVIKGVESPPSQPSPIKGEGVNKKIRFAAIAGRSLAEELGVSNKNGSVKIMIPQVTAKGGATHRFENLEITGTFESGMHDYDAEFVLMPLNDLKKMFGLDANVLTGVEIKLENPDDAGRVAEEMKNKLGLHYNVITWEELNRDIFQAVKLEKMVSAIIMGIMVAVAALNIVAVLVLMAIHRLNEIAILKAIGMRRRDVKWIFIRGGLFAGVVGVFAGLIAGTGVAAAIEKFKLIPLEKEIYLIDSLPVDISAFMCGMIAFFCVAVVFVTANFASGKFSDIPIAEGLRMAR